MLHIQGEDECSHWLRELQGISITTHMHIRVPRGHGVSLCPFYPLKCNGGNIKYNCMSSSSWLGFGQVYVGVCLVKCDRCSKRQGNA